MKSSRLRMKGYSTHFLSSHDEKHKYIADEELLRAESMQEDPQLVPSASPRSPSEEHKHMLGGQGETDESPNLRVSKSSLVTDERWASFPVVIKNK